MPFPGGHPGRGTHRIRIYDQNVFEFIPDVIIVLFTMRNLAASFRIAKQSRHDKPILIAGGKYPTFKPKECIEAGFHIALRGNVEETVSDFLDNLNFEYPFVDLASTPPPGYFFKDEHGKPVDTGIAHALDSKHYALARHLIPRNYTLLIPIFRLRPVGQRRKSLSCYRLELFLSITL